MVRCERCARQVCLFLEFSLFSELLFHYIRNVRSSICDPFFSATLCLYHAMRVRNGSRFMHSGPARFCCQHIFSVERRTVGSSASHRRSRTTVQLVKRSHMLFQKKLTLFTCTGRLDRLFVAAVTASTCRERGRISSLNHSYKIYFAAATSLSASLSRCVAPWCMCKRGWLLVRRETGRQHAPEA